MENQEKELSFDRFFEAYKKDVLPIVEECKKEWQEISAETIPALIPEAKENFNDKIKEKVLPVILKFFGDIKWQKYYLKKLTQQDEYLEYDNEEIENKGIFQNEELQKSGLFPDFLEQLADDTFEGSYKGVTFRISESKLGDYSLGGSYTNDEYFRGLIISFKYNKKVKCRTVITTKKDYNTLKQTYTERLKMYIGFCVLFAIPLFMFLSTPSPPIDAFFYLIALILFMLIMWFFDFKKYKQEEPLNKITLEDPKFNKRFNVYSSDEVEARYLVTPLFMEMLNDLETVFGTDKLKCSFFDDNLMIAISTNEDVFEIGDIDTPCDDPKFVLQFWRELSSIYKMIEYFKLNEKIFLS